MFFLWGGSWSSVDPSRFLSSCPAWTAQGQCLGISSHASYDDKKWGAFILVFFFKYLIYEIGCGINTQFFGWYTCFFEKCHGFCDIFSWFLIPWWKVSTWSSLKKGPILQPPWGRSQWNGSTSWGPDWGFCDSKFWKEWWIPPRKINMEPENRPLERKIIFETIIFRFYVNLPECKGMMD